MIIGAICGLACIVIGLFAGIWWSVLIGALLLGLSLVCAWMWGWEG